MADSSKELVRRLLKQAGTTYAQDAGTYPGYAAAVARRMKRALS